METHLLDNHFWGRMLSIFAVAFLPLLILGGAAHQQTKESSAWHGPHLLYTGRGDDILSFVAAVTPNEIITVAWIEVSGIQAESGPFDPQPATELFAQQFGPLGNPISDIRQLSDGRGTANKPAISIIGQHEVAISWVEDDPEAAQSCGDIRLAVSTKEVANPWEAMSTPPRLPSSGCVTDIDMGGFANGRLILAWSESLPNSGWGIYARQWTNGRWEAMGGRLEHRGETAGFAGSVDLALDPTDETIYIAWKERARPGGASLRGERWTGRNWRALPLESAVGDSSGQRNAGTPQLALNDRGALAVLWPNYATRPLEPGQTVQMLGLRISADTAVPLGTSLALTPVTNHITSHSLAYVQDQWWSAWISEASLVVSGDPPPIREAHIPLQLMPLVLTNDRLILLVLETTAVDQHITLYRQRANE